MSKSKKKKKNDSKPKYIIERRQFTDDRGRVIIGQTLVSGKKPKDFADYLGHGHIEAEIKTKLGPLKASNQVTFALEAKTVEGAFEILEERFEEVQAEQIEQMRADAIEKVKEHEASKSKIIVPGSTSSGPFFAGTPASSRPAASRRFIKGLP